MNDDDVMDPKLLGAPKSIYLNYGQIERDCLHDDCDEVTWCASPQDQADVKYVRSDLLEKEQAENYRLRIALHEIAEEFAGSECFLPAAAAEAYAIERAHRTY